MYDEFNRYIPLLLGVVFDCSERRTDGVKNSTILKNAMGAILNSDCLEPEDRVYFFNPEVEDIPEKKGGAIQRLLSYQPSLAELDMAIEQTMLLLACEPEEFRQYVIVITDKYKSEKDELLVRQVLNMNEVKGFEVNFLIFGFGKCDKSIKNLDDQAEVEFLDDVNNLKDILINFVKEHTGKGKNEFAPISEDKAGEQSAEE